MSMHLTEHMARTALTLRDHPGTISQIAKRSGVNMPSTRKNMKRLIADGYAEQINTWPLTFRWTGDTAFTIECAGVLAKIR